MKRRTFLQGGALAGVGLRFSRNLALAEPADSRFEILLDESIGTIAPEVYGHFVEHIGGVVYELELSIFIDRSIIEILANDRQCITQRVYPTPGRQHRY